MLEQKTLPNTGDDNNSNTMMTAGLLTTIGLVVFVVSKGKVKKQVPIDCFGGG